MDHAWTYIPLEHSIRVYKVLEKCFQRIIRQDGNIEISYFHTYYWLPTLTEGKGYLHTNRYKVDCKKNKVAQSMTSLCQRSGLWDVLKNGENSTYNGFKRTKTNNKTAVKQPIASNLKATQQYYVSHLDRDQFALWNWRTNKRQRSKMRIYALWKWGLS